MFDFTDQTSFNLDGQTHPVAKTDAESVRKFINITGRDLGKNTG